jgi:preprotein translocase subunit SecA
MSFLTKIFGDDSSALLKEYKPLVEKINALEADIKALPDEKLKDKTVELKERLTKGETLDDILPEAFALARDAARRALGERHYDVQLLGGIALHKGNIAEMRTGEGKTLVATLPAYLNALEGKGVHVVTVNDYLSRRDAVWMGQVFNLLGLSTAVINHDTSYVYDPAHQELDKERDIEGSYKVIYEFLRPSTRREAYQADITYGTNSEFGFDYLRDNLEYEPSMLRQRDFNYAIVDEIDSILIDEARTPLIISATTGDSEALYVKFADIAKHLDAGKHFEVDEKLKAITLTDEGITAAEKMLGVENIYTDAGVKYVHHLETAIRAKALYTRDKEYVSKDGEIVIVDEFTGRLQPGRRWSEGLHQAIEAKEKVEIQKESRTYASITYQNYFRLYKKLAGMTGTAKTSAEEFLKVYHLNVVAIPTNRGVQRIDRNDLIFKNEQGKFKAIARHVKELNAKGQPVLVGTASIEKNEMLSMYLKREGVTHEMLNAKNHEREGEIIAGAGGKGRVTIATNMAGRGVDIKLGGVPFNKEEYEKVKALGGLFVLGTERHEARRIDNQLRGRSGRQGDPGETQFFVSLEDNLMRVFANDMMKKAFELAKVADDMPIENRFITRSLETAQTRIEGYHFDSRKQVLEYDDVLNHQRKIVYERRRAILLGGVDEIEEHFKGIIDENDAEFMKIVNDKITQLGRDNFYLAMRRVILQTIDMFWVEHLEVMDYLRSSVNLRAYGQRDPLVEYKKEGLSMFKQMQISINAQILSFIPHLGGAAVAAAEQPVEKLKVTEAGAREISGVDQTGNSVTTRNVSVGRNDPCPCGSGKKYKKCHGA